MDTSRSFPRVLGAIAGALVLSASLGVASVSAAGPSGQVMIGNTTYSTATGHFTGGGGTVEPAIDDANGSTVYLFTPNNAPRQLHRPRADRGRRSQRVARIRARRAGP